MEENFQFAPIRLYSSARSNKKCKAIAEFMTEMFSRKFFISSQVSKEDIVKAVKKECCIIESKGGAKGSLEVSVSKTNEWGGNKDWRLVVNYCIKGNFPVAVCDLLCYQRCGEIQISEVRNASEITGEQIRHKFGLFGLDDKHGLFGKE